MTILKRTDQDSIAHLQMSSPERLNALSDELIAALQMEFNVLRDDTSIRAVILSGSGKAFCAGHDLKQMSMNRQTEDAGTAYFKDLFDRCAKMMTSIMDLPQPVIAQVHGIATAAGCQLVASCDMAIAEEGTKFGVNGVNIGLFCSTPMVALSRNIPRKKVFEMLTTGQFIDAQQAEAFGLINKVVPHGSVEECTRKTAKMITGKLAAAVKIGKRAFYEQLEMPIQEAYAYTRDIMVTNMLYDDTEEGIAAFLEKRDPDWKEPSNNA